MDRKFQISTLRLQTGFFLCSICNRRIRIRFPLLVLMLIILSSILGSGTLRAMPKVQRMVLPNGLVLLLSEEHSLPFVTLQFLIDSGSRKDPPGKGGLANLTVKGLLFGTPKRTVASIHEELDFMGASLNATAGRDYATVTLKILKKDLDKGLDLFVDVLTRPTFPEEE